MSIVFCHPDFVRRFKEKIEIRAISRFHLKNSSPQDHKDYKAYIKLGHQHLLWRQGHRVLEPAIKAGLGSLDILEIAHIFDELASGYVHDMSQAVDHFQSIKNHSSNALAEMLE